MSWAQIDLTGALSWLHLPSFGKGALLPAQIPLGPAFTSFKDAKLFKFIL